MSIKELFSVLTFGQIIKSIFALGIVPILVGHSFCTILNKDKKLSYYFIYGVAVIFAFLEFVSVPSILIRKSFTFVYKGLLLFIVLCVIAGIAFRIYKKDFDFEIPDFRDLDYIKIAFVAFVIIFCLFFLKQTILHQNVNDDDSRFVVNSVDILETNKMFLTNPATGERIDDFTLGDSYKDVIAPWALYVSALSKFTKIRVVTMAHSIMTTQLYVLCMVVWWVFAGKVLKKEDVILQGSFLILILLMAMHGNDRGDGLVNTVFMKFLYRLWQGKALLASAGIPMMYISLFDYYKKNKWQNIAAVFITNLAICFMSSNGVVIGSVMIACFCFAYTVSDLNLWHLRLLPLVLPNALLYFISNHVKGIE